MSKPDQFHSMPAAKTTPRELEREARRLLPILAKPQARARCEAHDLYSRVSIVVRPGQKKPTAVCDFRILTALCQHDWLQSENGCEWSISPAGLAWLARMTGAEDSYRTQHRIMVARNIPMPDGSLRPARVNDGESPLGWLRRRKTRDGTPFLSDEMVAAGERFRTDFTRAQMMPGITTDWERLQTRSAGRNARHAESANDLSGSAIAAKQRFKSASNALGPEMANIVIDVCCHLTGLGEAEKARRWPQRSAKLVLRLALDILARHYGISRKSGQQSHHRKPHIWRKSGAG